MASRLRHEPHGAATESDALRHLFYEGFTLNYPSVESHSLNLLRKRRKSRSGMDSNTPHHMRLKTFSKMLSLSIGVYARLNMYVTPYGKAGFKSHFDSHDVYVLQIEGSKRWRVYPTPLVKYPVSDWGESQLSKFRSRLGKPLLDVVLNAGDALFIPRGFVHEADCKDIASKSSQQDIETLASVHITLAIMTVKVADILFIAGRIGISISNISKTYLKRLKSALKRKAEGDESFRKAASPLCKDDNDQVCMKPTEELMTTYYNFVLEEFHQPEDDDIRKALIHRRKKRLGDAFSWIRKQIRVMTRSLRKLSLKKLRPVTHSMLEYRSPTRLDGSNP